MLFVGCSDFIVLKFEGANLYIIFFNLYIEPGDGKDLVFETKASEVVVTGLIRNAIGRLVTTHSCRPFFL